MDLLGRTLAPPATNPPRRNCATAPPFLDEEIALLTRLRVVLCLGKIAFDGFLGYALRQNRITTRRGLSFAHGAEYTISGGLTLLASYHPSLQNTNTGKLTRPMFLAVFERAKALARNTQ